MKMHYPKISVLMSVYNESEQYIKESIKSILDQTFSDFELIVIDDNPQREDVKAILDSFCDERVVYYKNPQNIGLAMSMNKAAEIARATIYARMDSDDVALPTRFQEQYDLISKPGCDFVFSGYSTMDENGKHINDCINNFYAEHPDLGAYISWKMSVIHHPTVMFKRSIFEKTGGYRNFPCSQDADLWFRMAEAGCKFAYIPKVLLKYRLNGQSVSSKKWFLQKLTGYYIFNLSVERTYKEHDSFSVEHYQAYLNKWGVNNPRKEQQLRKAYQLLHKGKDGGTIRSTLYRLRALLKSEVLRSYYFQLFKRKIEIRKNIKFYK